MTAAGWVAVLAGALAAALLVPPRPRPAAASHPTVGEPAVGPDAGWMHRFRACWSLLAGIAVAVFLTGPVGIAGGAVAAVVTWVVIDRSESPAARRERAAVARDLPHLVGLLGSALESGQAPGAALALVCDALPGAAADRLRGLPARLSLGVDPADVWERLSGDPELAALGRALARAHATGAPIGAAVARLGHELAQTARADVEDQARQVGVRAAVPLGLCLLPAFLLLGIVPLVAGLAASLQLG